MNAVLLDTHTLIWMVSDEGQLGDYARELLFESGVQKLVSPASYWEIAIKIKIGKLSLAVSFDEFITEAMQDYDLQILHIQPKHASVLTSLDLFHKDPFDRLLVAQASVEAIPIVSIDTLLDPYPVQRLWSHSSESEDYESDEMEVAERSEPEDKEISGPEDKVSSESPGT